MLYIPFILVNNNLVLWSTLLFRRLHTPHNVMLASLAVADILMGVFCIPMYALSYIPSTEHLIKASGKYACLTWFASIEVAGAGSLKNLLFLSVDRFIAVTYPLSYQRIMTLRNTYIIVGVIWFYVLVMAMVPFMGWNNYDPSIEDPSKRCNYYLTLPEGYVVWASFFTIAISIVIPLVLNVKIYYTVIQQQRSIRSVQHLRTPAQIKKFIDRVQSVRVTGVLCLLFILFWLPYVLVAPLKYTNLSPKEIEIIKVLAQLFNFLNAVINAPIYAFMRTEYKMAYYLLLTTPVCKWKRLKYHSLERPENVPWNSQQSTNTASSSAAQSTLTRNSSLFGRKSSSFGFISNALVSIETTPAVVHRESDVREDRWCHNVSNQSEASSYEMVSVETAPPDTHYKQVMQESSNAELGKEPRRHLAIPNSVRSNDVIHSETSPSFSDLLTSMKDEEMTVEFTAQLKHYSVDSKLSTVCECEDFFNREPKEENEFEQIEKSSTTERLLNDLEQNDTEKIETSSTTKEKNSDLLFPSEKQQFLTDSEQKDDHLVLSSTSTENMKENKNSIPFMSEKRPFLVRLEEFDDEFTRASPIPKEVNVNELLLPSDKRSFLEVQEQIDNGRAQASVKPKEANEALLFVSSDESPFWPGNNLQGDLELDQSQVRIGDYDDNAKSLNKDFLIKFKPSDETQKCENDDFLPKYKHYTETQRSQSEDCSLKVGTLSEMQNCTNEIQWNSPVKTNMPCDQRNLSINNIPPDQKLLYKSTRERSAGINGVNSHRKRFGSVPTEAYQNPTNYLSPPGNRQGSSVVPSNVCKTFL